MFVDNVVVVNTSQSKRAIRCKSDGSFYGISVYD